MAPISKGGETKYSKGDLQYDIKSGRLAHVGEEPTEPLRKRRRGGKKRRAPPPVFGEMWEL
jgi:hypothetical protein